MPTPSSIYKDPASNRLFYKDASGAMQAISDPTQLASLAKSKAIQDYQAPSTYQAYTPPSVTNTPPVSNTSLQATGGAMGGATGGGAITTPLQQPGSAIAPGQGSNMAFQAAFGKLMQNATTNQALQDQMYGLIKQRYDNPLPWDPNKSVAENQALQKNANDITDFQIQNLRTQLSGRATDMTNSLQYLVAGYKDDVAAVQKRNTEATATIDKWLTTFGSNLQAAGITQEDINSFYQTGQISPQLATKLMQATTITQQKAAATAEQAQTNEMLKLAALQQKGTAQGQNITVNIPGLGGETSLGGSIRPTKQVISDAGTIGSGTGFVAGVKVPSEIAGDVEDVLSGRNTLYNIRQTMGRTNKAAAYMEAMRSAIRKVDPKFDFVSSDAGGKFVSSTFYQRSMSAINSVIPNIDKVVALSNQVNRVGLAVVDAQLQKAGVQFGDKKAANFKEAQKLIADEIGLALGQGTVSDMKLQLGFDVTDTSVSAEVFASNMGLVKDFIENRKNGLDQQRYSSSVVGEGSDLASQLKSMGLSYDQMRADGYNDDEIKSAAGL